MPEAAFLLPDEPVTSLEQYRRMGGGAGLAKAHELGPAQTVKELTLARLRGRGGGGFVTGRKWGSILEAGSGSRYVVCNAAEGEPATFKDRALMRANPYQAVEGVAIAGFCLGAEAAYIGLKASFEIESEAMTRAVQEMGAAGMVGDLPVTIVAGPEEYLFGEEKALLEVIEGKEPLPRILPPFQHGLFSTGPQMGWESTTAAATVAPEANPTLVNNLETLSNVPHILARGSEWFRSMGTPESPGTICCTLVGDIARPHVIEVEMGTPLSDLVEQCGGPLPGQQLQAAFPGIANPVLTPEQFGTPLTYEDFQAVGSGLGAAGFAFFDGTACMVEVARAYSRFLYVESCGQCRSCKFGSGEITRVLERVLAGTGTDADVDYMGGRLRTVTDQVRCYLANQEQLVVASVLERFPGEFALHLEGRCSVEQERSVVVPKLVDLRAGVAVYDEKQTRKQPDWTYGGESHA